jgi:hypothetical protein
LEKMLKRAARLRERCQRQGREEMTIPLATWGEEN